MSRFALVSLLCLAACDGRALPQARIGAKTAREPLVRVHLRSLGEWARLDVTGQGGLEIEAGGRRARHDGAVTLVRTGDGIAVRGRVADPIVLRPRDGVFRIGKHAFAGELACRGGKLINTVPLENYLLGVLRGELPLKKVPAAAAAAQAIAARSFTLHYLEQRNDLVDVDDTTLFQRYVGLRYAPRDDHLREGVRATRGLCLTAGGEPLKAYYHSTCGGHTTDISTGLQKPNQAAMPGVACDHCSASKYFRWSAAVNEYDVLRAAGLQGPLRRIEVAERGTGDRALRLRIVAGERSKLLHAGGFRLRLGPSKLRSTRLTAVHRLGDGRVRFEGAGWGHGVGLCQMGAIGLAGKGLSGEAIAAYYYPGAKLRRAY